MDLVARLSLSTLRSCLGDGLPLEGHLGVSVAEVVLGLAALTSVSRTLPIDVVARKTVQGWLLFQKPPEHKEDKELAKGVSISYTSSLS